VFLLQVIISPILLVILLSVWNFQTVTVTAHAQSLLSDSEWLEENKDVFGKQELTLQIIPLRPSDLSSTPSVLPESFLIPLETGGQYFSTVPQKPAMPLIEQKDQSENPSGSFLSRLSPGLAVQSNLHQLTWILLQKCIMQKLGWSGLIQNLRE